MTTQAISPIENLSLGIYGDVKTLKTTFGLTAPKPLIIFDIDQSFGRAEAKYLKDNPASTIIKIPASMALPESQDLQSGVWDILVKAYKMPLRMPNRQLEGFDALWNSIILDFIKVFNTPRIVSIMLDTGTLAWEIDKLAELERKQGTSAGRERIIQIEYARPNAEIRNLLREPHFLGKNLIDLHHSGTKYGWGLFPDPKDPKRNTMQNGPLREWMAGFKETDRIVDVVCSTHIEVKCPSCNVTFENNMEGKMQHGTHGVGDNPAPVPVIYIEECGYNIALKGEKLTNPTYEMLLSYINIMRTVYGDQSKT